MVSLKEIGSSILLFFLVFGMSATVDIGHVWKQLRNRNALLTGISLQFLILPFVGFVVVRLLRMDAPVGITLLVVTSSPGGSYSNWWCSLFNAELALSVTMTAISTLLSVFMLPVNLILYATSSYSSAVVKNLDWGALFVSLIVVIGGIASGIICSAVYNSHRFNLMANKLGNIAGISLITYSAFMSNSSQDVSLWNQQPMFYVGVAAPAVIGVCIATFMATKFRLEKPERVAVAVEGCYQNTGIAATIAVAMFDGDDLAVAIGVPLFYGICEAVILAVYCLVCWKIGWTKAPPNENICVVITTSYEVENARLESPNAIEVVYNTNPNDKNDLEDLVFTQTKEGYKIDEEALNEAPNATLEGQFVGNGNGSSDHPTITTTTTDTLATDTSPSQQQGRMYESVEMNSPSKGNYESQQQGGISSSSTSPRHYAGGYQPADSMESPSDSQIQQQHQQQQQQYPNSVDMSDPAIPAEGKELT